MVTAEHNKQNNHGFSLVELIAVIAILGILTGAVTVTTGMISGKEARQCREQLLSSLENVRTTTLGKKSVTATIEKQGDNYVLTIVSRTDDATATTKTVKLAGSRVTLYSSTSEDGSGRSEISSLTISFDRASGALKANGTDYTYHIYAVENGKEYGIRIYPETGKLSRE